uniref:Macaca fascicularis brain cDNA clone: QflA-22571, similar to human hypothetical protein FLJ11151 (FLJ11151), mRNA, RefSeq: NM_018340.1 n=1 Tax=Macaca fascicularis TaxID=9541 RepID=I7GIU0_MACFA|nr:unnamed protein product [Macaca fascicularis]
MLIGLPIIYIWPDFYILISKNHQIFKNAFSMKKCNEKVKNNFERNSVNVENKNEI